MTPTIIIIGAGIAGLSAAQKLKAQGFDVTLLEANSRYGGRTSTDNTLGIPFDRGAFMFHGTENNPLADIAQQLGVKLLIADIFAKDFGLHQKQLSNLEFQKVFEQFAKLVVQAGNYARLQNHDMSLWDAMAHQRELEHYPDLTEDVYALRHYILTLYSGSGAKALSASHWNDDELELSGYYPFVVGGYQAIIDLLAKDLHIELNAQVSAIDYHQDKVIIKTQDKTYEADAIIITVPLGVLKRQHIQFMPPLPLAKTQAIDKLDMGVLNRIALKFETVFWPKEAHILAWLAKEYRTISWFNNYYCYTQQPILVGAVAGELAAKIELLEDAAVVDKAMETLRHLYGKNIADPTSYIIMRWGQDPYTYGSYSYIPVGASGKDYDTLAQCVDNKLYFAGEATIKEYPGTVHGAYFSGVREADKLIKRFGK
ncbi:MAG: FAD-dependent oxidoreductase [Candidatus Berkiella sp.]